jgi:divalent metal cation (Fe/Co/Zn/Cd) transporter
MKTGLLTYLWLVLRRAWRQSLDTAQSVLFALIIIAGLLTYFVPQIKVMIDLGGWQVAALIAGAVLIIRLSLAPYWIWKDQQIENQNLVQQLDRRKVREAALRHIALLRAREAQLRFRMEADVQSQTDWTQEFEDLRKEIADKIKEGFGPAQAELYTTAGNVIPSSSVRVLNPNHQMHLEFCIRDLDYLRSFIDRLTPTALEP